jgi:hypothetical protein
MCTVTILVHIVFLCSAAYNELALRFRTLAQYIIYYVHLIFQIFYKKGTNMTFQFFYNKRLPRAQHPFVSTVGMAS